ncbi:MAG: M28 family peptidase [Bacteroidetes bacterium]|uniref:M28 family metallopeptidase n=1 Tax=Phnomibacter sp. TaxID=2836217 RepID=UPI002FDCF8AA|nr:M28 family peptidase [Bacteroidota bacterium]
MRKFCVTVLFCCVLQGVYAQDSAIIRRWMDTLAAPAFHGRGYVNNGMQQAANWIAATMQQQGLQIQRQTVEYPVNVFPSPSLLQVNGHTLQEGVDYLIGPESGGFDGTVSRLLQVDSATWVSADQKLIVQLADKLTWSVATRQQNHCRVIVRRAAIASAPKKIKLQVTPFFQPSFKADNVIATVAGTLRNDSAIVFTAHYDHLGQLGNALFAGANDNASGSALLMQLACRIQAQPLPYKAVFIWFAGEEAGLVGSSWYVEKPAFPLSNIRFLLNLDLMGNGEEGITVVNATEFPNAFALLQKLNSEKQYLTAINSRGKAQNSDHYWFTEKGVPSFFWYTLGKRKAYHDVEDIAATVPLVEANDLIRLILDFSQQLILQSR